MKSFTLPNFHIFEAVTNAFELLPKDTQQQVKAIATLYTKVGKFCLVLCVLLPLIIGVIVFMYLVFGIAWLLTHPELLVTIPIHIGSFAPLYTKWALTRMWSGAVDETRNQILLLWNSTGQGSVG